MYFRGPQVKYYKYPFRGFQHIKGYASSPVNVTAANSKDPDQIKQHAASHQGQNFCYHKISTRIIRKSTQQIIYYEKTLLSLSQPVRYNFQKLKNISLKAVNFFSNKYKSNLFE